MADKDTITFDCSLQGVANRVSYALGDLTDTGESKGRYSPLFLCATVGDAIRVLAELKKEDFVREVQFDIPPGECVITLPEDCDSFQSFICFESGGKQFPVFNNLSYDRIRKLSMMPLPGNCDNAFSSFQASFSPGSTRVFAISPQIPQGTQFTARALCSVVEDLVTDFDQDLPSVIKPLIPALVSLTAYMLLIADVGDPTALAQANQQLNTVTTMLQITTAAVATARAAADGN